MFDLPDPGAVFILLCAIKTMFLLVSLLLEDFLNSTNKCSLTSNFFWIKVATYFPW